MYALIDCNAFFVSCERVFNPRLQRKPVVVLSSNDGCVVSRSNEAKALRIPMGVPAFEIRDLIDAGRVIAMSSNYALYGDLSHRVMMTLADYGTRQEIYSIDECFLDVSGIDNIIQTMTEARAKVMKWVGIPVSIGIGPTKTLAKLASETAKKESSGVHQCPAVGPALSAWLKNYSIGDVWGIGRQIGEKLHRYNVHTAADAACLNDEWMHKKCGVMGLRIVHELRGEACIPLEDMPRTQKSLCVSRSFGSMITKQQDIMAAVSCFIERGAEKLRKAHLYAGAMTIWINGNRFHEHPTAGGSLTKIYPYPTNYSPEFIGHAMTMVAALFEEDGHYKKAGVLFTGLCEAGGGRQESLFTDPAEADRRMKTMNIVDAINHHQGPGTLRLCSSLTSTRWKPLLQNVSPQYTSCWDDIMTAR